MNDHTPVSSEPVLKSSDTISVVTVALVVNVASPDSASFPAASSATISK